MGGRKAFEALREINPDIKVILSSGYGIDGEVQNILELGATDSSKAVPPERAVPKDQRNLPGAFRR